MQRERYKQKSCETENTNALHRGGQARISVEAPVIGVERRGLATELIVGSQLELGGTA